MDDRLKRQQDYQQFHLGIYVTLASAMIGAALFGGKDWPPGQIALALVPWIVGFLLLAGACGAMMAAKLPQQTDYNSFLESRIGFSLPGSSRQFIRLRPKTWEGWEHLFFWLAMILLVAFAVLTVRHIAHAAS